MKNYKSILILAATAAMTAGCGGSDDGSAGEAAGIYFGSIEEVSEVEELSAQGLENSLGGIVLPNGTAYFNRGDGEGAIFYKGGLFSDRPATPEESETVTANINGTLSKVYPIEDGYFALRYPGRADIVTDPIEEESDWCYGEFADIGDPSSYLWADVVVEEETYIATKGFCAEITETFGEGEETEVIDNIATAQADPEDFEDTGVTRDDLEIYWSGYFGTSVDMSYDGEADRWFIEGIDGDCELELDFNQINELNAFNASGTLRCGEEGEFTTGFSGAAWYTSPFAIVVAGEVSADGEEVGFWMDFEDD